MAAQGALYQWNLPLAQMLGIPLIKCIAISRASSLAWPNNYTNPRIVGAFSAVGVIEALQNCQDCRHGKSNLRGGGENTEEEVGKADARPRKSEYNDDTLASREQRQVNIHAEMAIRALPLAISLTTGRTFQCSIELRRRNRSSNGAPNPSHLRLSDSRAPTDSDPRSGMSVCACSSAIELTDRRAVLMD